MNQPLRFFQDASGTIPAINIGDPVGKVIRAAGNYDLEQTTTLSRPSIGRWPKGSKARNLLKSSEEFSTNNWSKNQVNTDSSNGEITVTPTASVAQQRILNHSWLPEVGAKHWVTVELKGLGVRYVNIDTNTYIGYRVTIDLDTGAFVTNVSTERATVTALADGWYRVQYWSTGLVVTGSAGLSLQANTGLVSSPQFYQGNNTNAFKVRRCQIEIGESATSYQATDVEGVPLYGYGAVRNLAKGAQAVDDPTYWELTQKTSAGITVSHAGSGVEDGVPYIDYKVIGTASRIFSFNLFLYAAVTNSAAMGDVYTAKATVRKVSGTIIDGETPYGIRGQFVETPTYSSLVSDLAVPDTDTDLVMHMTIAGNGGDNIVYFRIQLVFDLGATFDAVIRIKGLQVERSPTPTPLQLNYGPNNVTEQGVEDVYFLYNDGDDSLDRTLPTGTYHIVSVDVSGNIKYETFSGGTLNYLRSERTVDVIVKSTPFTDKEKEAIENMWSKYTL